MKKYNMLLLACISLPTQAAEWLVDTDVTPTLKYDDNELMNQQEQGDFSLSIDPTILIYRNTENSVSILSFGYQVERYDRLEQLDRQDPFAKFNTSVNTERSSYGLSLAYTEKEARSFADEDTGDFSNTSTVTTKSIDPTFSYRLDELNLLSTSISYRETSRNDIASTDTETVNLNLAWQRQFSERLTGGLSTSYSAIDSNSSITNIQNDFYSLSATSTYKYSERWDVIGSIGWRYLESDINPSIGLATSSNSSGETYSLNATRNDALSSLSLGISLALSPTSAGGVNEQNSYTLSYGRDLSERLKTSLNATYREFRTPDNDNDKTTYVDISPSLQWDVTEKLILGISYRYRMREENNNSNSIKSNAVFVTVNYDWNGIRFSR